MSASGIPNSSIWTSKPSLTGPNARLGNLSYWPDSGLGKRMNTPELSSSPERIQRSLSRKLGGIGVVHQYRPMSLPGTDCSAPLKTRNRPGPAIFQLLMLKPSNSGVNPASGG